MLLSALELNKLSRMELAMPDINSLDGKVQANFNSRFPVEFGAIIDISESKKFSRIGEHLFDVV